MDLGTLPTRVCLPLEILQIHNPARPQLAMKPLPIIQPNIINPPEVNQVNSENLIEIIDNAVDSNETTNTEADLDEAQLNISSDEDISLVEKSLILRQRTGFLLPGYEAK